MNKELLPKLKNALKQPLPGWSAQKLMTPLITEEYRAAKANSKQAAVLILLHPDENDELNVVYIKRPSNNPNDKHSGQISFAGGQRESEDIDLKATAFREAEEELGIYAKSIELIGPLTHIYVYVSDFYVEPFVGYIPHQPNYNIQKEEVAKVLTIPLKTLMDPTTKKVKDHLVRKNVLKNMPYFDVQGETLWGATAMITSEFIEIIRSHDII